MKVLAIGDCHVSDDEDLSRFNLLSDFIVDKQPDQIIFMGDFATLDVLSFFDKDKRKRMEGKRYKSEINACNKALDITFYKLNQLQDRQKANKSKIYRPKVVYLFGNHEFRISRYLDYDPTFDELVGIETDLKLKERNIQTVPYREYYYVNGVAFTHIPFNKMKEICGINITRKASQVLYGSCVFSHVHSMEVENFKRHGQDDLQQILSVGCFFEKHEDYVHGRITEYWKGLCLLDIWKEGRFDVETYSIERLKQMYNSE